MKSIFLFISIIFLTSGSFAGTIIVTNTNDSGVGSLRQAVTDAVDGDTIRFDPSLIAGGSDTILFNSEIDFSKGLTFKGLINGTDTLFLSGQGSVRMFDANLGINSTKRMVLDSMVFIDGFVSPNAGAVYFQGEEIEILNCVFRSNSAVSSVGAVMILSFNTTTSKSVDVLVENSVFKNNECWNGGTSALSVSGQENSSLVVRNSVFNSNTSQSGNCGALGFSCASLSSSVLIEDCEINNNFAGGFGGAVVLTGSSTSLSPAPVDSIQFVIRNTEVIGNSAQGEGGGLYTRHISSNENSSYIVTIDNCRINNNTSVSGNGGGYYSESNNHIDDINSAVVRFINSEINGNTSGGNGGGVYAEGVYSVPGGLSLQFENSLISQNSATNIGGGIYTRGYTSEFELLNSTVSGNTAIDGGGIAFITRFRSLIFNRALAIEKSTVANNTATNGGGVYMFYQNEEYESIISRYSTFYNNSASVGGAIYSTVSTSPTPYSLRLLSSIFVDNGPDEINATNLISDGYNVFNDAVVSGSIASDQLGIDSTSLNLGPLQNNGGFTPTHMPNVPSPAIDTGDPGETSPAQNWVISGIRESGATERASIVNDTLNITTCDSVISPSGNYVWMSSGMYSDTVFTSSNDTLFKVNLEILNTSASITENVCASSYTTPNGTIYTATGIYFDTTTNTNGCDSITTFDLTFNSPTFESFTENTCTDYTSPSGQLWTASGVYQDTIQNMNGCDSVMTITLNINQSFATVTEFVCGTSYTAPSGSVFTTSGIYQDTISNALGCDSVITIDLTLASPTTGTDVITACDNYTWINGNTYTTSNNSATHTLTNAVGCDSLVTLDLTILNSTTGTDVITACNSYTWIDGNTYTSSNNSAQWSLTNAQGCDSTVTLDLTINSATANVTSNDPELIADLGATSYQWLDCLNGYSVIAGATNNSFIPTSNGEYAVVIEENGCLDTSACFVINNVGLSTIENQNWKIYPNPTNDNVTLKFDDTPWNAMVEVTNPLGQIISIQEINASEVELKLGQESGVYFVRVISENGEEVVPVVKL